MDIAAVGFAETLVGFKLAGLSSTFECNRDNAEAKLNAIMDDASFGLIVLDQDLLSFISLKTKRRVEGSTKPVVITIPGKSGETAAGGESISVMIKRAIGVELKK